MTANPPRRLLRADDIPLDLIEDIGHRVVFTVGEKRSTWRRANLYSEAARQTLGWRFASTSDREAVTGPVVDAAERNSLRLTPPELALTPTAFTRGDGTSAFRPKHSTVFSAEHLLAAEDRLIERADTLIAPTVSIEIVDATVDQPVKGNRLSPEQARAIARIAVSGRQVDLLVGPAGAGKSTTMRALHRAWTFQHSRGSVVGLAPSAAAAAVLAEDLGIGCENTAKWLHDHDHEQGRARFRQNQLVIIDEATLAGTLTLDRITAHAAEAGAKVLLVGDWAQLQAVEAGGAFAMLVGARADAPELVDVHRFTHTREKTASLDLRHGHPEVIETYLAQQRVCDGDADAMTDAALRARSHDIDAGRASVPVTDSTQLVRDLNARARTQRLAHGRTRVGREVVLLDDTRASDGDWVITRKNDRRLRSLRSGWVRNGDRWRITDVRPDGSLVVRRLDLQAQWRRRPPRRLRRRTRRPRLRRHVLPGPGHHRRHRPRGRLARHDPGEPVRRHDSWP
ncbi:AAA family ATPase [Nocardioides sp. B-3]|uniref:AAA family ATPase n=1 Tax=Nocardioides sp. B-3 TaxID=2895565 RepID=UPI0021531A3C|nr:AAA family ATPase [Nocardioides sp. B-3]UUZ58217.1 AAA family ATPase [Nocardioides sp. B-3]